MYHKITLFHIVFMERVIFLNSFDLMMERYKKELVDANRRSMEQELLNQSGSLPLEAVDETQAEAADPAPALQQAEDEPTVSVLAEVQTDMPSETKAPPETGTDMIREDAMSREAPPEPDPEDNSFGTLKVQVFAAQQVYPISSARVIVRPGGEDKIIFEGYTDSSGIVDNIRLPSPGKSLSEQPNSVKPYSQYDVFVTQPNFVSRNYLGVPVFPGVESIQTVRLVPRQFGKDEVTVTIESEPNELLMQKSGDR